MRHAGAIDGRDAGATRFVLGLIRGVLALALFVQVVACGDNNHCAVDADCLNSDVAKSLGRCFPLEAYCEQSRCKATCAQICSTVNATDNPCRDSSLVCNDALQAPEVPYCTALPIACTSPDSCPLYRPADAAGTQYQWTCDQNICRYPGFHYAAGDAARASM